MADRFGYGEIGLDIHPCRGCEDYDAPDGCKSNGGCGKPVTNADHIRGMTDEELAIWLAKWVDCGECPIDGKHPHCAVSDETCACQWHEWLKQEVEE